MLRKDNSKSLFGKKVYFSIYYKKIRDGQYIDLNEAEYDDYLYKRYYEATYLNHPKEGIYVGHKEIPIKALLSIEYDAWDRPYVYKEIKSTVDCAIVYYQNNNKHYVPMEHILEVNS